ncbi:MAG: hypothetical protein ACK559_26805, partial [bacterium]
GIGGSSPPVPEGPSTCCPCLARICLLGLPVLPRLGPPPASGSLLDLPLFLSGWDSLDSRWPRPFFSGR